jgi:hypothetical protein
MLSAIRRFLDAGLVLPSLEIHFEDECRQRFGSHGRFLTPSPEPPWRIEVCSCAVYLHELAHAWERLNLTERDRPRAMGLLGVDSWTGPDIPWAQRGEEVLAHLIARVLGQVVNNHPSAEQLTDYHHFEQITGVPPPIVRIAGAGEAPSY